MDAVIGWFEQKLVTQTLVAAVGLVAIAVLSRFLQRSLNHRLRDSDTRYHARKLITFAAYMVGILFVSTVFSDRIGSLTVALGVAGAGITFALQEVIASIAGWVAVSFGRYYRTGDRVQLGGTVGDVIDIGVLRTTLLECG